MNSPFAALYPARREGAYNRFFSGLMRSAETLGPTMIDPAIGGQPMHCCTHAQGPALAIIDSGPVTRVEPFFPGIVKIVLGETGMPWSCEYGAST
jgi:hypothetical protein